MKTNLSPVRALAAWVVLLVTAVTTLGQRVPDRYIAVFRDDVADPARHARDLEAQHGVNLIHLYQNSIRGFAFAGNEAAAQAVARNPQVAYVEADQLVHTTSAVIPSGVGRIGINTGILESLSPAGHNVPARIAIIDTGLQRDHPDLNVDPDGVRPYQTTVKGRLQIVFDNQFDDDNGHGTHVGGTAAANGTIVGVAPGALLTAVKVLGANGSGANSLVIAGVDWVAGQPGRFDVANMSLGGGFSQASNDAVRKATERGIVFVVAAGNGTTDVSTVSPASEPSAITVSAMTDYDGAPGGLGSGDYVSCKNSDGTGGTPHPDEAFACFSNYGTGVDLCAPGVLIQSTWPQSLGDQTGYRVISGTSMATPHVTGAATLYIAQNRARRSETRAWVEEVAAALTGSGWRLGDYGYFDYHTRDTTLPRPTGDKDPIREPLLNVAALMGFSVRPNPDFMVSLALPANDARFPSGTVVDLSATAWQGTDDWTSSIVWVSNLDGELGQGGTLSTPLSDGTHTLVASIPDSASTFGGAATVTIVVGEATPPPKQLFITLSLNKPGEVPVYYDGETMWSYFDVTDERGVPVADAFVSTVVQTAAGGRLMGSGTTDASGRFAASLRLSARKYGYGLYSTSGSATKSGYLGSGGVSRAFELRK